MITVATNEVEFRANYKKLRRGLTPNMALRKSGKTLAARLMAFTPPRGDKDAQPKPIGARQEGMARVAKDIRRAVQPLSDDFFNKHFNERIATWLKQHGDIGDTQGVKSLLNKLGYDGDVYEDFPVEVYHAARGSRGRVRGKTRAYTFAVSAEGEYIRMKQNRVGIAKGGWYAGATMMGLGNVAPWIADKAGFGSATDNSMLLENPYIEFANRSVWAQYHEQARIAAENALKAVERDILRDAEKEIVRAAA